VGKKTSQDKGNQFLSESAFHTGSMAWNAGDREEAIRAMQEALRLCPENENAKSALAMMQAVRT